jgi:putative tricarboxylic transport membrane protein
MTQVEALLYGFSVAFQYQNLLLCLVGCIIGTLVGVLPGIGPAGALAMLLPVTLSMPPVSAVIMLAGIYYGAMYGGSTTAILINIPGEAASIVTTIDGNRMAQQGRAGPALAIAALGSFVAGTIAVLGLMFVAPPLASVALAFQSPEYVALVILGLTFLSYVSMGSTARAMMMAAAGLLLGTVGNDPVGGVDRFTLGITDLGAGFGLVPVVVGLFGVSEILVNLYEKGSVRSFTTKIGRLLPTRADLARSVMPVLRGSGIGFLIGLLPGGNAIIAAILSYAIERRVSNSPERFGSGAIEGVAGPESANNAASISCFVPVLTLGVPTNAIMALLLAALMIHGVLPGPQLISRNPELFWGTIASMHIGNAMLLVLNLPLVGLWVHLLRAPYNYLFPLVLLFCVLGAYTVGNSVFDLYVMIGFGVLGFVMRIAGFEPAPLILAYILGPLLEENLRRALVVSDGSFAMFLERPIALVLLLIAIVVPLLSAIVPRFRRVASVVKISAD